MPKLHLKRTPQDDVAPESRKRKKKASKTEGKRGTDGDTHRRPHGDTSRKWAPSDQEPSSPSSPYPRHSSSVKLDFDFDSIQNELEERRFREKMFEAFEDDERLDALEARLNDYVHIPRRWRHSGFSMSGHPVYNDSDDFLKVDANALDDEDYAEWVRVGMYR